MEGLFHARPGAHVLCPGAWQVSSGKGGRARPAVRLCDVIVFTDCELSSRAQRGRSLLWRITLDISSEGAGVFSGQRVEAG